jgi:hypothetical protein
LPLAVKLFEKLFAKTTQKHIDERNLLDVSQFGFPAYHSASVLMLEDHITLSFNNEVSIAAVFLDIKKTFKTTWPCGLLHELPELKFSSTLIKLVALFLAENLKSCYETNFLCQN